MSTNSEDSSNSIKHQPSQTDPSDQANPHIGHIYDVDSFLDHLASEMAKSGSEKPPTAPNSANNKASRGLDYTRHEPVAMGKATTQYVPQLAEICQAKRLPFPDFHIEGQADMAMFWGSLTVVGQTVTLTDRCRSKKEVKERLAEMALEIVKAAEALPKENRPLAPSGEGQVNWVGKLLEYHSRTFGPAEAPVYTVYAANLRFSCICTLPHYPNETFGAKDRFFSTKKAARTAAAAEAVKFLNAEGKLAADGEMIIRKKEKFTNGSENEPTVRFAPSKGGIAVVYNDASYAEKVNDLCPLLGLSAPRYQLEATSLNAPHLLSGYAVFGNSPDLPHPVGEVRNVFGKKGAKEALAKEVWEVLVALAARRGIAVDG